MGRKRAGRHGDARQNKRMRGSKQTKPETDLDFISKDDYVIMGGLIYVRPYVFEFKTHFKPRWRDQTVINVFRQEFKHTEEDYWIREIEGGRILTQGEPVGKERKWKDGLEVVHIVHRHESAVLSSPIHIARDEEGFIVVSKPPSLPIHPCGTYRRNCLQFILKAFHGTENLLAVHRLDKETSGLVILAKNSEHAAKFSAEIKERKVRKTYLAEVHGLFPSVALTSSEPLYWDKREMKASVQPDGVEAKTSFKLLSHNKKKGTSVVECKPLTGRTHQIRVHLAHVGYPIVNDPLYGNHAASEKTTLVSETEEPLVITLKHPAFKESTTCNDTRRSYLACEWSKQSLKLNGQHLTCEQEGETLSCSNCPQVTNVKNVVVQQMFIHLHALKYESDNWTFEVPPPPWVERNAKKENGEPKTTRNSTPQAGCSIV